MEGYLFLGILLLVVLVILRNIFKLFKKRKRDDYQYEDGQYDQGHGIWHHDDQDDSGDDD